MRAAARPGRPALRATGSPARSRQFRAATDSAGHYSIRVGPGTYTLMGPPRTVDEKLSVKDQAELVRDFRMPRPEKGTITGRVVLAGAVDKGVAGAKIEIVAANRLAVPFTVTADVQGRFKAERELDRLTICAKNPDGTLGAITTKPGPEDPEILIAIAPTASATGAAARRIGQGGSEPRARMGPARRSRRKRQLAVHGYGFVPKVVTDAAGRFTFAGPGLSSRQEYNISVPRGIVYAPTGLKIQKPTPPGPIDLGTLQIGNLSAESARGRPVAAGGASSRRPDAPGAAA